MQRLSLAVILLLSACASNSTAPEVSESTETQASQEILLLIGTYTRMEGHVNGQADGLYVAKFDTIAGKVKLLDTVRNMVNPSYIAISANKQDVYVAGEAGSRPGENSGIVYHLERQASGELLLVDSVFTSGKYTCHLTLLNNEQTLVAANYVGGIDSWGLSDAGSIDKERHHSDFRRGKKEHPRQDGSHAHMVHGLSTNEFLVPDLGLDQIWKYQLSDSGMLLADSLGLPAGSGPRHMAVHPQYGYYVLNELSGDIAHFAMSSDQQFEQVGTYTTIEDSTQANGAGCAAIKLHPDADVIYASNRGSFNSIACFKIQDDGTLSLHKYISTGGKTPRDFTISPDGKWLLIANQDSNSIAVYALDDFGIPSDEMQLFEVATPVCLKWW